MLSTPTQAPFATLAPATAAQVGLVIAALCALIARCLLHQPHLIVPLWQRLSRAAHRFARLMARLAAGRTPPPRPAASGEPRPRPANPAIAPRPVRLPAAHGRLVEALGWQEAAAVIVQLEDLFERPGVAGLLAACPAAARILRPIAHMLGCAPRPIPPTPPTPQPTRAAPPGPTPQDQAFWDRLFLQYGYIDHRHRKPA